MPVTVRGTDILFNDGTTQSTAPSVPNTLYAVGTYVIGRSANSTSYAVNSTIAGSSLYATSVSGRWIDGWESGSGQTLVNTGTWRCLSPSPGSVTSGGGSSGLFIRIS